MTPMMQQYREAKERHPGMLLFFRMGDFYELFDSDAEVGAKVLGLTLTSRDKSMPMAGFPHHQLENYLHKLLRSGHRVAICDQVEEASEAKGLVRREVTRVVTPGTITEDDLLDPRQSNYLVAVVPGQARSPGGVAWLELSTGQLFAADVPCGRLADELARLAPAECLCAEGDLVLLGEMMGRLSPRPALTSRPDWTFEPVAAHAALHKHFGVLAMGGFGFEEEQICLCAAGALLLYAQEMLKAELGHVRRLQPYASTKFLQLDEVTRRCLELTRTLREGGRQGSLLAAIDRTVTTMGARLLQDWLLSPLAERAAIEGRLDAVAELMADHALRADLRQALAEVHDLPRLTSRVSTGRASPRDLGAIAGTLRLLPRVKAKVTARRAALLTELEGRLELCPELRTALDTALVDEPPLSPREGGLVRAGYNAELDDLRRRRVAARSGSPVFRPTKSPAPASTR